MKPDCISWKEYTDGRKLPRLLTKDDIIQHRVNVEAEMLAEPEKVWQPRKVELPAYNLCPHDTGVWNFAKSIFTL